MASRPAPEAQSGTPRVLVMGAVALGLVALWVGSGVASGPDRQAQSGPTPTVTPVGSEPVFVARTPVPTPTSTPLPLTAPEISEQDRVKAAAWEVLGRAGDDVRIAYQSVDGMTVLVAEETDVGLALPKFSALNEPVELSRQAQTFGFGPQNLGALARSATGVVVATSPPANGLVARSDDSTVIAVPSAVEPERALATVPAGASVFAVDSWGIAIETASSTTLVGLDQTIELPGQLLDATHEGLLVSACDTCTPTLVTDSHSSDIRAPDGWATTEARYALSPTFDHALRILPDGSASMLETATGTTFWVADRNVGAVAWEPTGRYVAWLDVADEPSLNFMLVNSNTWLSVPLGDIDAPRPMDPSGELIVLEPGDGQR